MTPHRKKSPHVVQFVPRDWFETNSQHQKLNATLKAAKKSKVSQSTGKNSKEGKRENVITEL